MKDKNNYIFPLVLFIFLAGFFLRLSGINYIIPHPDEDSVLRAIKQMIVTNSMDPKIFFGPHSIFIYTVYFVARIYLFILKIFTPDFSKFSLFLPDHIHNMYRLGRYAAVIFGTLTLPVIYKITKDIFEEKTALIAAAFLAFGFLHTTHSAIIRPDIISTFLVFISIFFSIKIYETGKIKYYFLSSFFIGVAAAEKYTSILGLMPFFLAHILNRRADLRPKCALNKKFFISMVVLLGVIILTIGLMANIERATKFVITNLSLDGEISLQSIQRLAFLQQFTIGFGLFLILFASFIAISASIGNRIAYILADRIFLLSVIFVFLVFFIFTPYFFFNIKEVIRGIAFQFRTENLSSERLPHIYNFLWYINHPLREEGGLLIEFFALAGIIISCFKENNKKSLLLLSFGVIYFLAIGFAALRWDRWIIPFVPILMIFAAKGLVSLVGIIFKKTPLPFKNIILTVSVVVLMILPIYRLFQHNVLISRRDTRLLASEWIENNIPSGKKIALEYFSAILQPDIGYIKPGMFDSNEEFGVYMEYLKKNPPKSTYKIIGLKMLEFPNYDYGNLLKAKAHPYDYSYLLNEGVEYLVISNFVHDEYIKKPDRYIAQNKFYEEVRKKAQLIKEFDKNKLNTYGYGIKIYKVK